MAELERWVATSRGMGGKVREMGGYGWISLEVCVAKLEGWVAELEIWVAMGG
jgi:hypothetical protein